MSNPANGSATTKWLVGLLATAALAIGGWAFGATKAAEVRFVSDARIEAIQAKEISVKNERDIAVLKSQFEMIRQGLEEIKQLIREHEARSR